MARSKNKEIDKAKKELERLAMNPEEKEMYDLRMKAIRDEMNIRESGYIDGLAAGEAKGRTKGRAEGETKGRNERNIEIAKNMLKENSSIGFISKVTGLSPEEIETLK